MGLAEQAEISLPRGVYSIWGRILPGAPKAPVTNLGKASPPHHRNGLRCYVLAHLEGDQIRTANRQRTSFDVRPCHHLVHQATQRFAIPMVAALNVNRATNCDRSLAPPIGKTRSNVNKIYCAFEPIYILACFCVSAEWLRRNVPQP